MPFAATWMDLEIVILSEESERKTNIIWYRLYVESKKNGTNERIYKTEIYGYHQVCPFQVLWGKDLFQASLLSLYMAVFSLCLFI